jgi:type II secretory pathway pseudopilin PulG
MLVLGLLLVVLSGAVGVLLIAYNTGGEQQTVTMFGRDLGDVTMMQAFVAGLVVAAVFLIGLSMIMSAGRRARENRQRYREARREAKAAARERDELAEQLRKEEDDHHRPAAMADDTETMVTPPVGTPVPHDTRTAPPPAAGTVTQPRHAAPPQQQQPVITNIKPGDSPTR